MEKQLKHSETIKLLPSQFDLNDKLLPSAIISLFQDIASIHGEMIGVGFEAMFKKGLYWVTVRTKYDVLKQPKPYQNVVIETWPHEKGKVDFDRDYLIKDCDGNILIKGVSKWCVISTTTRRLELPRAVEYPDNQVYCEDINYAEKFLKTPAIEPDGQPQLEHVVCYSEIDHNMHLNNVHYADYVFNVLKPNCLTHMQINYIAECRLADKIKIYFKKHPDGFLVAGYVDDELKFTALAR